MAVLEYLLFDADNHYYETRDCFTRYIEPRYRDKAIRPVVVDGVERIVVGDKPFTFMDPKFDKTNPPGSLYDMVRNRDSGRQVGRQLHGGQHVARISKPRRPLGVDGRAGHRVDDHPADPRGVRRARDVRRRRADVRQPAGVQQVARRRMGFRSPRSHLRTAADVAPRPRRGVSRARPGACGRGPSRASASRSGVRSLARRSVLRSVLGAARRSAGTRCLPHRRLWLSPRVGPRVGRNFDTQRARTVRLGVGIPARRSADNGDLRRARSTAICSVDSPTCAHCRSRTGRAGSTTSSRCSTRRRAWAGAVRGSAVIGRVGRAQSSASTYTCRRIRKTTSRSSSIASAPSECCSAVTIRIPRASHNQMDSWSFSKAAPLTKCDA